MLDNNILSVKTNQKKSICKILRGVTWMNLPIYNDNECILAAEELSKHVNGKEAFSLQMPNVGLGITVTGNLSNKNYRQSYYKDCLFDSTLCNSIGFSGSKFIKTIFIKFIL